MSIPSAQCVLAPNPGPMTLEGTNTWLLSAPGSPEAVVVDPGPDDDVHLQAVLAAARARGVTIRMIALTHGHLDHSAGAQRLAELTGARLHIDVMDGDQVGVAGLQLEVIATPGHTGDSVCFLLAQERAMLTGDTILGRGTTVVAHPDGRLGDYLASLQKLAELAERQQLAALLPGHGPVLRLPGIAPVDVVRGYLWHRGERLSQVRGALAAGDLTAAQIVARVYRGLDERLWPAAELSVLAQLEYLKQG